MDHTGLFLGFTHFQENWEHPNVLTMASPSAPFKTPAQADKWKQKQNLERNLISKGQSPGRGCGAALWELPRTAESMDSIQARLGDSLGSFGRLSLVKEKWSIHEGQSLPAPWLGEQLLLQVLPQKSGITGRDKPIEIRDNRQAGAQGTSSFQWLRFPASGKGNWEEKQWEMLE